MFLCEMVEEKACFYMLNFSMKNVAHLMIALKTTKVAKVVYNTSM